MEGFKDWNEDLNASRDHKKTRRAGIDNNRIILKRWAFRLFFGRRGS
jgi:hypothetical protein